MAGVGGANKQRARIRCRGNGGAAPGCDDVRDVRVPVYERRAERQRRNGVPRALREQLVHELRVAVPRGQKHGTFAAPQAGGQQQRLQLQPQTAARLAQERLQVPGVPQQRCDGLEHVQRQRRQQPQGGPAAAIAAAIIGHGCLRLWEAGGGPAIRLVLLKGGARGAWERRRGRGIPRIRHPPWGRTRRHVPATGCVQWGPRGSTLAALAGGSVLLLVSVPCRQ